MDELDRYAPFTGQTLAAERAASAERHLVMLRHLLDEVLRTSHSLVPRGADGWRSTAADRYVERLGGLREQLTRAQEALVSAEAALAERVRQLNGELAALADAQRAQAAEAETLGRADRAEPSWTTR